MSVGNGKSVPVRPELPDAPPLNSTIDEVLSYLPRLSMSLVAALNKKVSVRSPTAEILLYSPNGSVYSVSVDNAGVISSTLKYSA